MDSLNALTTREIEELKVTVPLLAANIQNMASEKLLWREKLQDEEFARMAQDPYSQAVFMALTDQVFRLSTNSSILKKFVQILRQHGVPSFFNSFDKAALTILKNFGPLTPGFLCPPIVWSGKRRVSERDRLPG